MTFFVWGNFLKFNPLLFDDRGKEIWRRENVHLDIVHKEKDEVIGKFIESGFYFDKEYNYFK